MNRKGRKPGAQPSRTSETALASMATDVSEAATEATLTAIADQTDKLTFAGGALVVASSGGGAATGGLTNTELRAVPVLVTTGDLTNTQLRAAPVPVSGSVTATGPLTDAQLRAAGVPVSGPLTDAQIRATPLPIAGTVATGGLTDVQLRASGVPVLGPVTDVQLRASAVPVSGPLTDTQLRAVALPVKELKDAGRNVTNYFMAAGIAATAAEVMQALTGYKGGVAVAATATPAVVTAGKTYRLMAILLSFQSLATVTAASIRLRCNLTGVAIVTSPLVASWVIGSSAAVAGVTTTLAILFPDGMEFPAGAGLAIGVLGLSTIGAAAASGFVTVSLQGYEY